jgi:hypothetical protein
MSDEEDQQAFRNQDLDGLEQGVDQDEDMDVGSKHKSSREVEEGDPEEVDEEGDDEDEDDDDEEEEDESQGRKGRKRAKVY